MKKTLIALAVAASAVVSCSAMASGWEQDSNGSVEFGGTLTPVAKGTPWEVKTGDAVTNLDAQIQKGQTSVEVNVNEAIPVLGIRNADVNGFTGREGIKPQISYNNAVDIDSFYNGVTMLTLSVQDVSGSTIGSMLARFSAAAVSSWSGAAVVEGHKALYAGQDTDSFYGGLGKGLGTVRHEGALELITALSSDFVAKWKQQGEYVGAGTESFNDSNAIFFGVYGAGIEKGQTITIKLNNAVANDDRIQWKASLPVTVTYM
ncbi:hypothetical protein [Escherichia coli]|uniref:F4 family fimbrial subunit n=1 Tax=Escherichia coli TaxID=562 RepID=UPI00085471CA|nr:hypothetical protein [Escherichia coli]OEL58695.1 hypothetical protein BHF07_11860 [Escherichia coli]OEN62766.1 hypothetical protein BHF51_14215 [Escherichia coli]